MSKDLTIDKLKTLKNSLKTDVLEPHQNLKAFYNFIGIEVENKTMNFRRKEKEDL